MIREAREEADIEITPSALRVVRVNTQKVCILRTGRPVGGHIADYIFSNGFITTTMTSGIVNMLNLS